MKLAISQELVDRWPVLYNHQRAMAKIMEERDRFCFWYDTGVGKTLGSLEGMKAINQWPALILTYKNLIESAWIEDCEKFTPDLKLLAGIGTKKKRMEQLREIWRGKYHGYVVNWEALKSLWEGIRQIPWKVIVMDESTKIKSPEAKTTEMAHALCHMEGRRVYALSGCPTPNHDKEYWGQVQATCPGQLEQYYQAFLTNRFYQPNPTQHAWLWRYKPGEREKLEAIVGACSLTVKREDCLDLPEQTYQAILVDLSKAEQEAYEEFVEEWVVRYDDGVVTARSALAELMKSRQMTAGIVNTASNKWIEIGSTKIDAICEMAWDLRDVSTGKYRPLIIVGAFRYEIERYAKALKKRKPAILYGGLSDAERKDAINGFKSGKYETLIIHPQSAGHGLTFVNCADMIFASLTHSFEHYYQVCARILRIGQERPVNYYIFLARGTVDESVFGCLQRKEDMNMGHVSDFAKKVLTRG